jgi:FkbM family methyltransferase
MVARIMNAIRSRFKSLLRPVFVSVLRPLLNVVRKIKLRRSLLNNLSNQNSVYDFSELDVELYVEEQFAQMLPLTVSPVADIPDLVKVEIKDKSIFWPKKLTTKDLPWLYHEIFDSFSINPSSYDNPLLNIENRKWIMDAGAAEGYFSVFSLLKTQALVIAIEPLAMMRPALAKTLDAFANGRETIIISAALSDKSGWSEIQIDFDHICDSTLSPTENARESSAENIITERVALTTIDEIAQKHSLGCDGMIKMDIEGYEMAALSGAVNVMRDHKPSLAIAVYHEFENAKACADIIREANPSYNIEFRGCYGYFDPPRPYMVFAY